MNENFLDQDTLYVEVTAQNTVDKAIYKFKVSVGRIATIKTLKIGTGEVLGKGVAGINDSAIVDPGTANPDTFAWGSTRAGGFQVPNYDQPNAGFAITIELDDPRAKSQYTLIDTIGAGLPAFNDTKGPMKFTNTNALAIKITSDNGKGIMYYKIKVDLLAGVFEIHPASAQYYYCSYGKVTQGQNGTKIDYESPTEFISDGETGGEKEEIAPLTFKLVGVAAGEVPAGATIQWYEANSWYGGYGFDPNGKITYTVQNTNPPETVTEAGFDATGGYPAPYDKYHGEKFDEKLSTSTMFNGGNQGPPHYPLPGRKILGPRGTASTYTPDIDKRPFVTGWSAETHYYWVEITDILGYKVTSGHAVIVSERNKDKKHYVVDTNNNYKVDGIPQPFKNVLPFKAKYDYFRIPLTFAPGFDIMEYSIMFAQAKFYLADGTPWIQNWTNGNLAFEDNTGRTLASQYSKDGLVKVLYYNLTNYNGTLSIDGDTKEGEGFLGDTPTHVVVSPSGDHLKGDNKDGYPPLVASNDVDFAVAAPSIVGTNLQGWFCGFIELVELRFESPTRKQ
jgi:hypothetical protein